MPLMFWSLRAIDKVPCMHGRWTKYVGGAPEAEGSAPAPFLSLREKPLASVLERSDAATNAW
jgi:hypothetical protein